MLTEYITLSDLFEEFLIIKGYFFGCYIRFHKPTYDLMNISFTLWPKLFLQN